MKLSRLLTPKNKQQKLCLPLFSSRVRAGFPSPADDFIDQHLDLNELLVQKPSATFFAWAEGDSLKDIGIYDGDLLIVDRSIKPKQNMIVVAALDGELTCKILDIKNKRLLAANHLFPAISIAGSESLIIEGVITHSIKKHVL